METRSLVNRRQFLRLTALGAAGTALVAACAPAAPPTATPVPAAKPIAASTEAPKPTTAAPAVATATPAPAAKPTEAAAPTAASAAKPAGAAQTLVMAMSNWQSLDPHFTVEAGSYTVGFGVYETLVRNKVVDGKITGEMEPYVARSWEVSPDGLLWSFRLRDDVKFSDGSKVDANAVKFSFDRLMKLNKGPYTSFFGPFTATEVVDPLTVRLKLKEPFAPFLSVLATYGGSIINPKVMSKEKSGDLAADYLAGNLEGSGPYVFKEWVRGQQIVLEANPNYWGPKPKLQRIIFRIMEEPSAVRLALMKGDVDWTNQLTPDMLAELEKQAGIKVITQPVFMMTFGYMNNTRKPFDNPKVRQAVCYAIDYNTLVDQLMRGTAEKVRGPIPPGMLGHDDSVFQYKRDLAKAKQLLAEAGLPNGFTTTMVNSTVRGGDQVPQLIQANLAEVGIKVNLQKIAEPTRRELIEKKEFEMSIGNWLANFSDPHMFMGPLFDSRNRGLAGNRSYYMNEQVDALVRKAAAITDTNERAKLYRQAQDIIMQDAPYFFLFYPHWQVAVRDSVKGVALNPSNTVNIRFDLIWKE